MYRNLLTVIFTSLVVAPLYAQRLKVESSTVDVGQVVYRQPATAQFQLRNNDGKPLTIHNVETSCGCTSVNYPQQAIPGHTDFNLSVTYDAKQMGHFEKYIYVSTSAQAQPLRLTLKGIVVEEVNEYQGAYDFTFGNSIASDRNYIEYADVHRGETPFVDIHVKNISSKPVSPVVMHLPQYLQTEISPTTIPPGKPGLIRLRFLSSAVNDYGLTQTTVYVGSHPGDKVSDNKALIVNAVLLPPLQNTAEMQTDKAPSLQLSDDRLVIGPFAGKAKKTAYLTIENTGQQPLHISALQVFTPGVKVSLPKRKLNSGEHTKMKVVVERKQLQTAVTQPRILMITNDPKHSKVMLDVVAEE